MIKIKKSRQKTSPQDGFRILVDDSFPEKSDKVFDCHYTELSPTAHLRKWFSENRDWEEFQKR